MDDQSVTHAPIQILPPQLLSLIWLSLPLVRGIKHIPSGQWDQIGHDSFIVEVVVTSRDSPIFLVGLLLVHVNGETKHEAPAIVIIRPSDCCRWTGWTTVSTRLTESKKNVQTMLLVGSISFDLNIYSYFSIPLLRVLCHHVVPGPISTVSFPHSRWFWGVDTPSNMESFCRRVCTAFGFVYFCSRRRVCHQTHRSTYGILSFDREDHATQIFGTDAI